MEGLGGGNGKKAGDRKTAPLIRRLGSTDFPGTIPLATRALSLFPPRPPPLVTV